MRKILDLWYCKFRKKTNNPITVRRWKDGKMTVEFTNEWSMELFDKDGKKVIVSVKFNNATGEAKTSGATSMLEVSIED